MPQAFGISQDKITKTRILLADDHPLVREALRMWIEKQQDLEVIAEASDGREVVQIAAKLQPDIVIMDINMPRLNGIEATKRIKDLCPATTILALTVYNDEEHMLSMKEAGASGYITKNTPSEEVIHYVRNLIDEEGLLPPSDLSDNHESSSRNLNSLFLSRLDRLTDRELAILKLVAIGINNKEIAKRLSMSVPYVKATLTNIFLKLHVNSRTEAVSVGLKAGIITLDDLN